MKFHKRAYKPTDPTSLANMGTDLTTFQARQLEGLAQMISTGAGSPEITTLKREVWEGIPKPHFKEMHRLSKLTGVEPSVHAPMIDTVGINPKEKRFSDEHRKNEERIIEDVLDKAHIMAPERNPIVNIHSEIIGAGTSWYKNLSKENVKTPEAKDRLAQRIFGVGYGDLNPEQKQEFDRELQKQLSYGVDRETGQIIPLRFEIKQYPEGEEIWSPQRSIENMNKIQWMGEVEGLHQHEFRLNEVQDRLNKGQTAGLAGYQDTLLTHSHNDIANLFHKMQKNSRYEEDNWKKFKESGVWDRMSPEKRRIEMMKKEQYLEIKKKQLEANSEHEKRMKELAMARSGATSPAEQRLFSQKLNQEMSKNLSGWSDFFANTVEHFTPHRIIPIEDFEVDKASDTFAEAAEHSLFKTAKGNLSRAPIIAIENPPAQQFGLSRGEEMAKLVEESRRKAVDKFKKKGMSESEAKHAAEKLIGVTWDVGHINQLRQGGYDEKDILKDTEKVAPFIKHMHLTDNFGATDSHLPPGMGNVPIKEMQDIAGKAGFKGKSVIEAGGFISNFKKSPWPYVLDEFDSPIYEFDAADTWRPAVYQYEWGSASYPAGYGNILPSNYFQRRASNAGAGFLLPPSLGASPGEEKKKSGFSGTQMS
ncbi:hypothetical protein GF374_00435 [Candidatus Woesearchaeota archaeon]|nr:hypothetical protein [Candidatus Woesearchaeota archaeon]